MKRNMGIIDRVIRTALAVTIAVLYFIGLISGTAAIVLGAFAVIFLVTSLVGFCPLYAPFRLKTCKGENCGS